MTSGNVVMRGKLYREELAPGGEVRRTRLYEVGERAGGYVTRWVDEEHNLFVVLSPRKKIAHLAWRVPDETFAKFMRLEEAVIAGSALAELADEVQRLEPRKRREVYVWLTSMLAQRRKK